MQFKLQDFRGAWHELDEVKDRKLVVLAFLGTECPLANIYAPRLAELARGYEKKGVAFFGVDSNEQDAPSRLARFAKDCDLPFPLLKDVGNELADRLGVERTPEVFVLDSDRVVRYRGRVDDQFGLGVHRAAPTRRDLTEALESLLAGRPVATSRDRAGRLQDRTRRQGGCRCEGHVFEAGRQDPARSVRCLSPRGRDRPVRARFVQAGRRLGEHDRRGGAGRPDAALARQPGIRQVLEQRAVERPRKSRRSPPGSLRGHPKGDAKDLPEPAKYVEGWRIPAPDLRISLPRTVKIQAEGTMPYENFMVDPKLKEDVWVRASQVRPGNPSVVHHLVVFVIPPPGTRESRNKIDFLAAYAPGMPPRILPEGAAKLIPAGSKLMFQVHYTPRGIPQTDRSEIGLVFADPKTIRKEMTAVAAINMDLKIPAGNADYAAEAYHRFDQDTLLYSLLPHMHLRGKAFRFEAVYPDRKREVLLDVPRYEFEWQNVYVLEEPKLMPEGTVLRCLARYDNSSGNPSNPDPSRDGAAGASKRATRCSSATSRSRWPTRTSASESRRAGSSTMAGMR